MSEPEIIASRYRVVRELGRGGMGVVYVVEHTRTGDQVALKLLHGAAATDPQSIERFKREARASARIKNEHVVKVIDADVAAERDNAPFLVMELLNGKDLREQVETSGKLPVEQVVSYLTQAARALDKSHSIGIVHRDLKPENLFLHVRDDGTTILKILDFGISKIVATEAAGDMTGAGITSTGSVMGTPLYMAPEQARGRVNEIAPTTDVWAVGLIAVTLLTGEIYWPANTVAELMAQILSEPMYPPTQRWPWLPAGIDAWFARSCSRDPKGRFLSVGEQVRALGVALAVATAGEPENIGTAATVDLGPRATPQVASLTGVATTSATSADRRPTTGARRRTPLVAAAAVVVLAAAGVLVFREGSSPSASAVPSPPSAEPLPTPKAETPRAPQPAPEASSAPVVLAPPAPRPSSEGAPPASPPASAAPRPSPPRPAQTPHPAAATASTATAHPATPATPTGAFNPAAP